MQSSNIVRIVDYTAVVAAGIDGVKSVAASGQGDYEDPLRVGSSVAAAPSNPTSAFSHWSDVPDAPPVEWVSQSGTVELAWKVPMRLWLPKGDLAEVRRQVLPFYDRYLRAFVRDRTLGGLVLRADIMRFAIGGNDSWSWLDVGLTAIERVNYYE